MSLKTLVFIPSGKTPYAFLIKRQCELRLRFVLVECNPRRSAQSGDQIRYKEYNRSSSHRQRLALNSAASQESWARRNSEPNVGPRNVYVFMASGTECDQISFGIIPPGSIAVAPSSYWARLTRFSPGSNRKRMSATPQQGVDHGFFHFACLLITLRYL
jgi:hypothetical protein